MEPGPKKRPVVGVHTPGARVDKFSCSVARRTSWVLMVPRSPNIVCCAPLSLGLVEIMPPTHVADFYRMLAAAAGHRYERVVGYPISSDRSGDEFAVDLERVEAIVDGFDGR